MSLTKYKVLIIDDSKAVLELLENTLAKRKYAVKTATNPITAYEMIRKENFNIVITDIEMPEMNGLALLKKIKNYNGMIQVIVITGYITINNTLNSFRYGAENLFFKPLDAKEILKAVNACAAKLDRVNQLLHELAQQKA